MPAASDPHSSLLLPPSNFLDLDTLLPHIGQCLRGDDDCDFDGADDVDEDDSDFHYPALPWSGYLSTYLHYII